MHAKSVSLRTAYAGMGVNPICRKFVLGETVVKVSNMFISNNSKQCVISKLFSSNVCIQQGFLYLLYFKSYAREHRSFKSKIMNGPVV